MTLREPRASGKVPFVGTTEATLVDLEARVTLMRRLGVVRWADIELGPEPTPANASPTEDETQRSMTLEREKTERDTRLRFGASGGPRPAVAR